MPFNAAIYSTVGFWVGVAGFVATVLTVLWALRRRVLRVVVLSNQRFAPTRLRVPQDLEVVYEGKPLRDVQLLSVILLNTGRSDITEGHFVDKRPVRLVLDKRRTPTSNSDEKEPFEPARIIRAEPVHDLQRWEGSVRSDEEAVMIGPCRITRLGWATLAVQVVVANYHREPLLIEEVDGRPRKRSRQILENGSVGLVDMERHDWRGVALFVAAVASLVLLLVSASVAPKYEVLQHHVRVSEVQEPFNTILLVCFGVWFAFFLLCLIYYGFVAVVYKRKVRLFQ